VQVQGDKKVNMRIPTKLIINAAPGIQARADFIGENLGYCLLKKDGTWPFS
jgi:hypothetical protein